MNEQRIIVMDPQIVQEKDIPLYRFVVIGRMGDGKSSLCRFLTGDDSIQVSSKIESCTHSCNLHKSSDKLNEERGFKLEVLDTPGLDSREENMLQIVMELADIFTKCEYINGILYAVSMSHARDETISWFLNFLRLYFSKEQLAVSIIPILTHYDKILFEDDEKIMQLKNSRKEAIVRIMGDQEQVINFWENNIQWINDASQKEKLKEIPDFKHIYFKQLERLVDKGKAIRLDLAENAASFEQNLLSRMMEEIRGAKVQYEQQLQEIPAIKFRVQMTQLKFHQALKKMNSLFSKIFIGAFVYLGLKGYAHKKYKHFEKSQEKAKFGLFEHVQNGIDKLMEAGFNMQFYDLLTVETSSKDKVEDLNRIFSCGGICYFHLRSAEGSPYRIESLELKRIYPEGKQECVQLKNEKGIIFQDKRRFTKQEYREYKFRNIKILRPSNQFLEGILKNIVKK